MNSFSVIIPTYNHKTNRLAKLLPQLRQQKGNLLKEIILIDSSTNRKAREKSRKIAKKYNAIFKTIPNSKFDHGGTRNLGARAAQGSIICFMGMDIDPIDDQLLLKFNSALEKNKNVAAIYARQLPKKNATPIESVWRSLNYPAKGKITDLKSLYKNGAKALIWATPCACIRKKIFEEIGGFPEKIIINEDGITSWKILKAGYKTQYLPSAEVRHSHKYNLIQNFQRYFDFGVSFSYNKDILKATKNVKSGFKDTIHGAKILSKYGYWYLIPYFFIESFIKFIGYSLGKNNKILPLKIKKFFSMYKSYWNDFLKK